MAPIFLESKHIPDIQRLIENGTSGALAKLQRAETSLSVALFLALAHRSLLDAGNAKLAQEIQLLNLPGVSQSIACLHQTGSYLSSEPFGAPPFDLYRIGSKHDLLSQEWSLFCDRFRRSAANRRKGKMYTGVAGVLSEMADNVVWHAFALGKPCPALAGFHVANDVAAFCVADSGQGFLNSLRNAPAWATLQTDHDALDAVISKHATSRPGEKQGGGFKQLFNSLLDFNGLVMLRSGACAFQMENSGSVRQRTSRQAQSVPGASITVIIAPKSKPSELPLK